MRCVRITECSQFATQHPDQTTYFKPVLDVLDYNPSKLENIPNIVMVEGKNDFYTMAYLKRCLSYKDDINLMQGNGSGSLDAVIRLYVAWGREFIILLDSDGEGEKQKKRYNDIFGALVKDRIFLLRTSIKTGKN